MCRAAHLVRVRVGARARAKGRVRVRVRVRVTARGRVGVGVGVGVGGGVGGGGGVGASLVAQLLLSGCHGVEEVDRDVDLLRVVLGRRHALVARGG